MKALRLKLVRLAVPAALAIGFAALPLPAQASGYTHHTLYTFSATDSNGHNADGASIGDVVSDGMGHLYGATSAGGANGDGTLFEFDLATKTLTTLVAFSSATGILPSAVILDGQGHLFGTTYGGGSASDGTVFEYDTASGSLTTLVTFTSSNGGHPAGSRRTGRGICMEPPRRAAATTSARFTNFLLPPTA